MIHQVGETREIQVEVAQGGKDVDVMEPRLCHREVSPSALREGTRNWNTWAQATYTAVVSPVAQSYILPCLPVRPQFIRMCFRVCGHAQEMLGKCLLCEVT